MPSLLHEGLIALVRDRPAFAAELMQMIDVEVPRFTEARLAEAAVNQLLPIEYTADAVVVFGDRNPVFGAIFEPQLQPDERKFFTWPYYATAARARHECQFIVVAVTPDPATARWASRQVDLGGGVLFHVKVIGPEGIPAITDTERAIREPQLALLSVMAHGRGEPTRAAAIANAAGKAVLLLPDEQRLLYSALIQTALSEAARKVFDMLPDAKPFLSESQRRSYAEGEARGKAAAILRFLLRRDVPVTESARERVLACRDLETLDRWLDRAATVTTGDDLFDPQP